MGIICVVTMVISQDKGCDDGKLLQNCYIYFKKDLKNVNNVLK